MFSVRVSVRVRVRASVMFIVRFSSFSGPKNPQIRTSARPHFTRGRGAQKSRLSNERAAAGLSRLYNIQSRVEIPNYCDLT